MLSENSSEWATPSPSLSNHATRFADDRGECPELGATRPDLLAILGEYDWIWGNVPAEGVLSLRLPRGRTKEVSNVTGEITWGGGACEAWCAITGIMPAVDSAGKEFWNIDVDECVYENGSGDEPELLQKGHMLYATEEKDDEGNVYLIWKFVDEDCWMIGKKRWKCWGATEGDKQRLRIRGFSPEPGVDLHQGKSLPKRTMEEVLEERKKLGLEKMVLRDTRPDEKSLLGNYRWIYNSEDVSPWNPRDCWSSGLALFRNRSGGTKITGRLNFWSSSDGAEVRRIVAAISPSVNEEGKEIWSMKASKFFQREPRFAEYWENILLVDGHQLGFTVEKDDAGNPFLVLLLCWSREYEWERILPTYSFLIGKKQANRFGRLGFSVDEYVRLAHGTDSRVEIHEDHGLLYDVSGRRLSNPMRD